MHLKHYILFVFLLLSFNAGAQSLNTYWADFPFYDGAVVESREAEQKFAMYLIPLLDSRNYYLVDKDKEVGEFVDLIVKTNTADRFLFLAEKYLYEPNSPYYNDELYLCFLKSVADKRAFDKLSQSARYKRHYIMMQKNKVGSPATDFTYETQECSKGTLYAVDSEYLILFFNDPSCSECKRVKEELISKKEILTSLGIKVFALYIDNNPTEWRLATYPTEWINGYAPEIDYKDLYNIRALPCLYLLDENKYVILRDVGVEEIINHIQL